MPSYIDWIVVPKSMFLDVKSVEPNTGVIKPKYKLYLGKHPFIEEIFIFLKSTSSTTSVNQNLCVKVEQSEWENLVDSSKYLQGTSMIDIRRKDILNLCDIENKCSKNLFHNVAKLPEYKYTELIEKVDNLKSFVGRLSPADQTNVRDVLSCLLKNEDELKIKLQEIGLG